ncbi:amiloride-sensitive sodium channel subunit alpha [Biomphalaria glabrata]|nr:amiloride-sensitive sodium channel subunit alpha-like; partial [Biomphalaria glabrata]
MYLDTCEDDSTSTGASFTTKDAIFVGKRESMRFRGLWKIFSKYADISSLNGVPFIMQSRHCLVKVAWSLLLVGAIGASIFHLYYLFSNYFEYQKYSQVQLKFDSLKFPAVTICNVNMMRISQKRFASEEIQSLFQTEIKWNSSNKSLNNTTDSDLNKKAYELDNEEIQHIADDDDLVPDMSNPCLLEWVKDKERELCQHCSYCWDQGQLSNSSLYEIDDYFQYLFNKQSMDIRQQIGHQKEGLIRMCSFAGRMCGYELFQQVVSPQYGNCYTLHHENFTSRKSGIAGGLELILSLETDEYTPAITSDVGARVIIHEPGTAPFLDDNDIAVSPGMHTFIALKKVEIIRIGEPFSSCISESHTVLDYKYTKPACQKACEQMHIKDRCNCIDSDLDQSMTNTTMSQCKSKEDLKCLYQVRCELETKKDSCNCTDLCRESTYEKTIATLQWPTDSYVNYIRPSVCNASKPPSFCKLNISNAALRDELVKLNIYFGDLNYEELADEPNYEITNLLSDIGGSIGLWIGMSVLSVFELIHLALELIRYFSWRKWRKRAEKRKQDKEKTKEGVINS